MCNHQRASAPPRDPRPRCCPTHPKVVLRHRPDPMGLGDLGCQACDEGNLAARLSGVVRRANDVYGL